MQLASLLFVPKLKWKKVNAIVEVLEITLAADIPSLRAAYSERVIVNCVHCCSIQYLDYADISVDEADRMIPMCTWKDLTWTSRTALRWHSIGGQHDRTFHGRNNNQWLIQRLRSRFKDSLIGGVESKWKRKLTQNEEILHCHFTLVSCIQTALNPLCSSFHCKGITSAARTHCISFRFFFHVSWPDVTKSCYSTVLTFVRCSYCSQQVLSRIYADLVSTYYVVVQPDYENGDARLHLDFQGREDKVSGSCSMGLSESPWLPLEFVRKVRIGAHTNVYLSAQ